MQKHLEAMHIFVPPRLLKTAENFTSAQFARGLTLA
jgi:hypothetical protein